jgi:hypothetical protein
LYRGEKGDGGDHCREKQGDEDGSKRVGLFGFEAENKKILHS